MIDDFPSITTKSLWEFIPQDRVVIVEIRFALLADDILPHIERNMSSCNCSRRYDASAINYYSSTSAKAVFHGYVRHGFLKSLHTVKRKNTATKRASGFPGIGAGGLMQ